VKKWRFAAPAAVFAAVAVAAVAVVGTGTAAPSKPAATTYKVGLVSDVAKFNDKGFNQAQLAGAKLAAKQIPGVEIGTAESRSAADYLPNLASFPRKGYNLVIAAGFLLADAEATAAKQFPNTKFAITDYDVTGAPFKGQIKNVEGLTYATQQNSYLVGCLAALMTKKQGGTQTIGVVGGLKIPSVDSFLAGYQAGAKKCNPNIKVLTGYSQSFTDPAACKTVAQNQIDAGSQVEFNVAGPCGLATLDAADQAGVWAVGVDVDQYVLHPQHTLTSAIKRVDRGVYLAIQGAKNGTFAGGKNLVFNLKNGGVGLGRTSPAVPATFLKTIAGLKAQIVAGKIKPPTTVE
jgi:basic membrane protein A and related proteins